MLPSTVKKRAQLGCRINDTATKKPDFIDSKRAMLQITDLIIQCQKGCVKACSNRASKKANTRGTAIRKQTRQTEAVANRKLQRSRRADGCQPSEAIRPAPAASRVFLVFTCTFGTIADNAISAAMFFWNSWISAYHIFDPGFSVYHCIA